MISPRTIQYDLPLLYYRGQANPQETGAMRMEAQATKRPLYFTIKEDIKNK